MRTELHPLFDMTFGNLDRLLDIPSPLLEGNGRFPLGTVDRGARIFEDEGHFYLRLEVPGYRKEELNLDGREDHLKISGERKAENGLEADRFEQGFRFGIPVSVDGITARLDAGILTVTLPKKEKAEVRRITVDAE